MCDINCTCITGFVLFCLGGVYGFLLNTPTSSRPPYKCTFENNMCGYTSTVTSHGVGWSRHLIGFGQPNTDHTYNTPKKGHVLHIASGSSGIANQVVNLTSPIFAGFPKNSFASIGFWYTYHGDSQKGLRFNVYVKGTSLPPSTAIFSEFEISDTPWKKECSQVLVTSNLVLTFEIVILHSGSTGEFAIDDVTVERGMTCSDLPGPSYTTASPHSVTTTHATTSVTCDFEDSHICGYQATGVTGDNFDWTRLHGSTLSTATGPTGDHTTSHGYYMYIETSSPRIAGDKARLISPKFTPNTQHHVTFWYHAYGKSLGSLKVYAERIERYGSVYGKTLFQYSGPSENRWKQGCINIPVTSADTRLVFEGIRGTSYFGDIAIDDVRLDAGTCSSGSSITTTHTPTISVDGSWSDWTTWSACSTSCDLGMISRSRSCTNPSPTSGGKQCNGTSTETHECSLGSCPVWSEWFDGKCSSTCGNGTLQRMRSCSTGNNADCVGNSRDFVSCVGIECI